MENNLTIKELEQVVRWGFNGEVKYPIVYIKENDRTLSFNGRLVQGYLGKLEFSRDCNRYPRPHVKGYDKKYKMEDVEAFINENINELAVKNAETLEVINNIGEYIDLLFNQNILTKGECYMLRKKHKLIDRKETEVLMVANGANECAIDSVEEDIHEEDNAAINKNTEALKHIYDTNFNVMSIAHSIRKAEKRNVPYKEAMSRALKMAHALCKEAADFEIICRDFNFEISANVEVVVPKKVKEKIEKVKAEQKDNDDKPKVRYILSYDEHNFYINGKAFKSNLKDMEEVENYITGIFLALVKKLGNNIVLEYHRKVFKTVITVAKMNESEMAERNIVLKYVGE